LKHNQNAIKILENALNATPLLLDVFQLHNVNFNVNQSQLVSNATGMLNQSQNVNNKRSVVLIKNNVNKTASTQPSKNATTKIIPAKTVLLEPTKIASTLLLSARLPNKPEDARSHNLMVFTEKLK